MLYYFPASIHIAPPLLSKSPIYYWKTHTTLISLNSTLLLYISGSVCVLSSARVTGLALCWSWEIDNAPETRNKNAARGCDTRIPYYANTGVILKTNRWLLFPYISVLYVSVSRENKTFNVSSPMMDLTFNHCSEWRGFIWREENKMQEFRH